MPNTTIELIRINGKAKSRDEAIAEAAEMLVEAGAVTPEYLDSMFARESSVSTYMGNYLAIPHGTHDGSAYALRPALAIIRYDQNIDWDGEEVRFVVGIASDDGSHLDSLAMLAEIFSDIETVEQLLEVNSEEQFTNILSEHRSA